MSEQKNEIRHHLSDDILMAYSAGAMPEAFGLVVATHVSLCDACRARLEGFDAVGGALLADCDNAEMEADSLERTMALIAAQDGARDSPRRTPEGAVLPEPLRSYVEGGVGAIRWRSVGGGVKQAVLPTSKEASVRLLRIPPGAAMPTHGHRGTEMTLVLQGAFKDEFDRFARGDVEVANEDHEHQPIAEDGVECICLAATDAPLRFNSFIPRLAQRFVGI